MAEGRIGSWVAAVVAGMGAGLVTGIGALSLAAGVARAQPGTSVSQATLGGVVVVEPGVDTLHDAVARAEPGDTLLLQPGLYTITHSVLIDKDLTIQGATHRRADVHIAAVPADVFDFQEVLFADPLDWGHMLFAREGAHKVAFRYFTIKNAPEVAAIHEATCESVFGLNHSECFGDAIHTDGVAVVEVDHLEASLNAGNGIWVDGAESATFRNFRAVNNGAFGIDVDTARELVIRHSTFIANQVSGIEASGHEFGVPRDEYVATVSIWGAVARGNGEIGIEVERFKQAKLEHVICADNREDGFDADRVGLVEMRNSAFVNNLDDGMELFPVDVVDPVEQPADFPGNIIEIFENLRFAGNVGQEINHPPTEN